MINKLVLENLKYRWVRTLLSALVVGVQVMSILTLIGLSRGMLQESASRAKGTGADIFLKPDTQGTFSFSTGQLNQKFVDLLAKQPHVKAGGWRPHDSGGIDHADQWGRYPAVRENEWRLPVFTGRPAARTRRSYRRRILRAAKQTACRSEREAVESQLAGMRHRARRNAGQAHRPTPNSSTLNRKRESPADSQILVKLDDPALTDQEVAHLNQLAEGQSAGHLMEALSHSSASTTFLS